MTIYANNRQLQRVVDEIFGAMLDMSLKEIAYEAGLAYSTVCKLNSYKTKYPRIQTVMQLAQAAGLKITVER